MAIIYILIIFKTGLEDSFTCIKKTQPFLIMIYLIKNIIIYRIYCRVNTFNLVYLQQQKSKLIVSNGIFVYKY